MSLLWQAGKKLQMSKRVVGNLLATHSAKVFNQTNAAGLFWEFCVANLPLHSVVYKEQNINFEEKKKILGAELTENTWRKKI